MKFKIIFSVIVLAAVLVSGSGCAAIPAAPDVQPTESEPLDPVNTEEATEMPEDPNGTIKNGQILQSDIDRAANEVPQEELRSLAEDMNLFAVEMLQQLSQGGESNLFYSPYSIELALAMAYAGANGVTAEEMAEVLHFEMSQDRLHPILNALDQSLYEIPEYLEADQENAFQLNIANATWGQDGYPFKQSYLDVLAENYGAGLRVVDFIRQTEEVRQTINDWVADETEDKIQDLLPPGSLDAMTRLVLTNAIYFNAAWQNQFDEKRTEPKDFLLSDQSVVQVDMMNQTEQYAHYLSEDLQIVEIPYLNARYSMVVMMPRTQDLAEFIQGLNADALNTHIDNLNYGEVILSFPKFEYESEFSVSGELQQMGMQAAFSPEQADFSGMYEPDGDPLFISEVIHKAFVAVDEEGTEAAAATAVIMKATGAMPEEEPVELTFDQPFFFLIRDRDTNLILFMGSVANPAS